MKKKSSKKIYEIISKKLNKKYSSKFYNYNLIIINKLIFNEECLLSLNLKEFLLFNNSNEFLHRFYFNKEIIERLKKILIFYEKYSKIFPNYIILPENKFLYKNIRKKQKMIDAVNKEKNTNNNNNKNAHSFLFNNNENNNNIVFTNSIKLDIKKFCSENNNLINNSFDNNNNAQQSSLIFEKSDELKNENEQEPNSGIQEYPSLTTINKATNNKNNNIEINDSAAPIEENIISLKQEDEK